MNCRTAPISVHEVQVAVVQLEAGLDKAANRRRAVESLRRAADQGAGLVVLPEAAMCGFGRPDTPLAPMAEPLDGPFVTALATAAAETGVHAIAGMFERCGGDRVFNTVVVVGPSGLLARYRKVHLYDALGWCESARIRPGDPTGSVVVEVGELQVGILTCYDLRFPELARALVDAGATVLAVPAAWVAGPAKAEQWSTLLRARAIENVTYVVAAGQPGPGYTGRSTVVDPDGTPLAVVDGDADGPPDGLVVTEVVAERVVQARARMPLLDHRRFRVVPDR
jgi:predicted amidohydrolase